MEHRPSVEHSPLQGVAFALKMCVRALALRHGAAAVSPGRARRPRALAGLVGEGRRRLRAGGQVNHDPPRVSALPRSPERSGVESVKLPTDYEPGYARAQAIDPDAAARYVAHRRSATPRPTR